MTNPRRQEQTAHSRRDSLQVGSTPPTLAVSTAHHWYSFPAPNSPTVPPPPLDRGPWVKHRGECSITTRSDPIKCRFNQPCSQWVNTKSHQSRGNQGPGGVVWAAGPTHQRLSGWLRPTSAAVARGEESMELTSGRRLAFVYGPIYLPRRRIRTPHPLPMAPAANRRSLFLHTGSSPVI